ncbi:MAG: sigma-54 dependent transcriptional regulator [Syntrophus sp. (in: bacteria)]
MSKSLVFVVDDEPNLRKLLTYWIETDGHRVRAFEDGAECLAAIEDGPDVICLDVMMPGMDGIEVLKTIQVLDPQLPVIMVTAKDNIEDAVTAMQQGAYDYITKPIDRNRLRATLAKAMEKYAMAREIGQLRRELGHAYSFDKIIGKSKVMTKVFTQIEKVLNNNINIFINGESGTGKELVARAIHYHGARKGGPFEAVNCGAIPENLQESEFFGHQKGAFTGATQSQIGKIEMAKGGTLFLDEVGEMTPALQIKLLRFLQDKTFEPVGGRNKIKIDVRIISATNKNLEKEVEKGRFREDLFYRLVVFPITIPPLRERKEDIPAMINHFLRKYEKETGKEIRLIDHRAMEAIVNYEWPGNVRELENVIYRAMVICEAEKLDLSCLPPQLTQVLRRTNMESAAPTRTNTEDLQSVPEILSMEELEKKAMLQALVGTQGNLTMAAKQLGMGRATFYRKIDKYALHELSPFLKDNE